MTKKDYVLIASVFYYENLDARNDYLTLARIADTLADKLKNENPRFDKEKFIQACGLDKE